VLGHWLAVEKNQGRFHLFFFLYFKPIVYVQSKYVL
jgi:hypothetical protein